MTRTKKVTEPWFTKLRENTVTHKQPEPPLEVTDPTPCSSQALDQHRPMSTCQHPTQTDFGLNQNQVLCLPLVTDDLKLIWTCSEKQNQQLDGPAVSELQRRFDAFPYPTQPEMSALALRHSLHPDQVSVWFMVQRLRHGISWNGEEIGEARAKLGGAPQPADGGGRETGEKKKSSPRVNETYTEDELSPFWLSQSLTGRIVRHGTRHSQLWHSFWRNQRPPKEEHLRLQRETGLALKDIRKWFSNRRFFRKAQKLLQVEKEAGKNEETPAEAADRETAPGAQEHGDGGGGSVSEPRTEERKQVAVVDEPRLIPKFETASGRRLVRRKTHGQLMLLREVFMTNQWPNVVEYTELERRTGLKRHTLTQWFGDMRYHVKNGTARWVNPGERPRILAKVRQRPRRV